MPPLTIDQVIGAVKASSQRFEEVCALSKKYTSKSWWVTGIAQVLAEAGLSVATDVRDQHFRHSLGNLYCAVHADFKAGIDVLACEQWSRHRLGDENYGQDESHLPAFHAVKIFCNDVGGWSKYFELSEVIRGPLTISVIGINVFAGGEGYFNAAEKFRREMRTLKVTHAVSTKEMRPGLLASVTLFEPLPPFQIFLANKVLLRAAVPNCNANDQ